MNQPHSSAVDFSTFPDLFASDLDGTLIDEEERVGARTATAIRGVLAAGAQFIFATGRPPRAVDGIAANLGHTPVVVCANGAIIYDTESRTVLGASLLEPDALAEIVARVERVLPAAGFAVERVIMDDRDAATKSFLSLPGYEHAWLHPENVESTLAEVVSEPAVKLLARIPGMTSAAMLTAAEPAVLGLADITYSTNDGLIEFAVPGTSKSSGIKRVLPLLGLGPDADVVAFGDMPNDVDMLAWARVGVSMGNAHPAASAAANLATGTSDQEGVADILERFLAEVPR